MASEGFVARGQARAREGQPAVALLPALALALLLATVPVTLHGLRGERANASAADPAASPAPVQGQVWPAVRWRHSRAVGLPNAGRLVRGVQLPVAGADFFSWDAVLERAPNRAWRRWGTDRLVRMVLAVAQEFRAANPGVPRVGIADLSRPNGGEFGPRFGGLGHASHQNGLDVDVAYPRVDRLELAPDSARQIDRALSQDLVDRFVRAGAEFVFVGPHTGLKGRASVVQPLVHHDDHMHVRIPPAAGRASR